MSPNPKKVQKKRKRSTQAEMLRVPAHVDSDAVMRQRRIAATKAAKGEEETLPPLEGRDPNIVDDDDPTTPINNSLRAVSLDAPDGGDIAAENEEDKENTPVKKKERPKFISSPPVKGNVRHALKPLDPVNVLVPLDVLKAAFGKQMVCPNAECTAEEIYTLEVESHQCGLASEIFVKCKCCGWCTAIMPPKTQEKDVSPSNTPTKKKRPESKSELFHRCAPNCCAGLLMQHAGMGLNGLDVILAFLGMQPNHGSNEKWRRLMDRIGLSECEASEEVMLENTEEELELTWAMAETQLFEWMENTAEGKNATLKDTDAKRMGSLMMERGKVGIYLTVEGAWQKRKIGAGPQNSASGHNFGVGSCSGKISSVQVHSKHCHVCEVKERLGRPIQNHRCPHNFNVHELSKFMEPVGMVQHCTDTFNSCLPCYVGCAIGDNDIYN